MLCLVYVLCTSAPTQPGCDRGDRVNDRVSDNNKYSRAAREREGGDARKVCDVARGCSVICLDAWQDEAESMSGIRGRIISTRAGNKGPKLVCCCGRRAGRGGLFWFLTSKPGLTFPSNLVPELAGSTDPIALLRSGTP